MSEVLEIYDVSTEAIEVITQGPQGPPGSGGGGGGSGTVTSVSLAGTGLSITGSPVTTSGTITANVAYGTTAGTACQGNDSRLSNARTPTAHASSHWGGGSDPLTLEDLTVQQIQNGSIYTWNDGQPHGSINTGWGNSNIYGGSINTSEGGGSIDTRGTGSIEFGSVGTRTTLTGTATADRAISLPDAAGTLALTSDITKSAVGLGNVTNNAQVTSVSGTAPIVSSGGTTPVISVTTGSTAGTVAAGDHTHTNFSSLRIDPANGSMGSLVVGNTTSGPNNFVTIDNKIRLLSSSNSFVASLDATALSADRAISLPNATGTVALTSDITKTAVGLGNVPNVDTTNAANISSGVLPNARVNWATPSAIGSTAPSTGAFTALSASDIFTASNAIASPPTSTSDAKGIQFTILGGTTNQVAVYGSYAGTPTLGIGAGTSTGSLTEIASFNLNGITLNRATTIGTQIIGPQGATVGTTSDCAIAIGATNTGFVVSSNQLTAVKGGSNVWYANNSSTFVVAAAMTNGLTIENTGSPLNLSRSISLFPDATGTLVQRSGTTAQSYLLNATYTSSTNYQRLAIRTKVTTLSALAGVSAVTTGGFIPDGAVLVGLTTRVSTAITGATGYDIGDGTDQDRWGANIGIALNTSSDNTNWTTTTVQCFTAAQEVTLTAVGGNFTGGAVQIVAHYLAGEAD